MWCICIMLFIFGGLHHNYCTLQNRTKSCNTQYMYMYCNSYNNFDNLFKIKEMTCSLYIPPMDVCRIFVLFPPNLPPFDRYHLQRKGGVRMISVNKIYTGYKHFGLRNIVPRILSIVLTLPSYLQMHLFNQPLQVFQDNWKKVLFYSISPSMRTQCFN